LRTTEGFRTLGADVEAACEGSADIERVLTGTAPTATMVIGETQLEISAVTDGAGVPHALLRLPTEAAGEAPAGSGSDDWVGRLRAALEERPVLAWLKDTTGRHLYVSRRYLEALQVPEDRLLGHTDDELAPGETVDGPRRSLAADGIEESQELEYTVPAFAHRPAFAAVRFLVRGPGGEVLGVCGLAAPLEQAQLVRLEADRLASERSTGINSSTQDELLRQWGVALAGVANNPDAAPVPSYAQTPRNEPPEPADDTIGPPEPGDGLGSASEATLTETPPPPNTPPAPELQPDLIQRWDECVQRLQEAKRWQDEVSQSRSVVQQAQEELSQALAERDAAQQGHDRLREEREQLERALTAERTRNEDLVRTIEQLRIQISDVGRTIDHALLEEQSWQ
jgi:PAS domain-containing protein